MVEMGREWLARQARMQLSLAGLEMAKYFSADRVGGYYLSQMYELVEGRVKPEDSGHQVDFEPDAEL